MKDFMQFVSLSGLSEDHHSTTRSTEFTAMKGHVSDGAVIIAPSGKRFTLKNTMKGWEVLGADGLPCSGNLSSAFEVEYFIVNGLSSH